MLSSSSFTSISIDLTCSKIGVLLALSPAIVSILSSTEEFDERLSKSKYYDYDQSVNPVCLLRIQYHIHDASRPYPGWLSRFR